MIYKELKPLMAGAHKVRFFYPQTWRGLIENSSLAGKIKVYDKKCLSVFSKQLTWHSDVNEVAKLLSEQHGFDVNLVEPWLDTLTVDFIDLNEPSVWLKDE